MPECLTLDDGKALAKLAEYFERRSSLLLLNDAYLPDMQCLLEVAHRKRQGMLLTCAAAAYGSRPVSMQLQLQLLLSKAGYA